MKLLDPKLYDVDGAAAMEWLRSMNAPETESVTPAAALLVAQAMARGESVWFPNLTPRLAHCVCGQFSQKHALSVQSWLNTQPYPLTVWIEGDIADSAEYLEQFLGRVIVKRYDPMAEAVGTPLEGKPFLAKSNFQWQSDFFRTLILYKYGGLYFDLDTLWLRPLSLLFGAIGNVEFAYRWGIEPYCNSAVMCLRAGGENASKLIQRVAVAGNAIPWELYRLDNDLDMLALLAPTFDPYWTVPHLIRLEDTFRESTDAEIDGMLARINGSFAHHWHGLWGEAVSENCLANRIAHKNK
jgi:Glycosyltransferase sugar-binding region containing DXD motif